MLTGSEYFTYNILRFALTLQSLISEFLPLYISFNIYYISSERELILRDHVTKRNLMFITIGSNCTERCAFKLIGVQIGKAICKNT